MTLANAPRACVPALLLACACASSRPVERPSAAAPALPPAVAEVAPAPPVEPANAEAAPATDAAAIEAQAVAPVTQPSPLEKVLAAARQMLGVKRVRLDGRLVRADCSRLIRAAFHEVGVELFSALERGDNGVRGIYRYIERFGRIHHRELPAVGDLAFFHDTYDRNRDGRRNDPLTHVGIVDEVLADGTAVIIHWTRHGIVREAMNLFRPHDRRDEDGRTINAVLRAQKRRNRPAKRELMGELFQTFGTLFPAEGGPEGV